MRLFYPILFALCLLTGAGAHAQNVPAYVSLQGLVAWYPFSGNSADSSGNAYNATVNGPTLTTDRFGNSRKAYNFNGTSDYMRIATTATSGLNIRNGSFSISAWFKTNWQTATHDMQIFWRGDAMPGADPYMLYITTTGNAVFRRDVNTGTTVNAVSYPLLGNDTSIFHHFVGTFDTTTDEMTIYMDGVIVAQSVLAGTAFYNSNNFFNIIGAVDAGNQQNFKGKIDDIGVWSRALTHCEVTQLFYANTAQILQQPVNASVNDGGVATFSISDVSNNATYQWQVNTAAGWVNLTNTPPYSGVGTPILTINPVSPALNGNEYRVIRDGGGCIDNSSSATLSLRNLGVNPGNAQEHRFTLYPNPNIGRFTLGMEGVPVSAEVAIEVADMTGRILIRDRCSLAQGKASLDYSNRLAPGVYLLKLFGDGQQKTLVFSKTQ